MKYEPTPKASIYFSERICGIMSLISSNKYESCPRILQTSDTSSALSVAQRKHRAAEHHGAKIHTSKLMISLSTCSALHMLSKVSWGDFRTGGFYGRFRYCTAQQENAALGSATTRFIRYPIVGAPPHQLQIL